MGCATMTVVEMAGYLGIGRNAAYQLVKQRRVPVVKIGKQFKIPKSALERWLLDEAEKSKSVS